jgi:eukaryotic-like serine/threonine-protein kinase
MICPSCKEDSADDSEHCFRCGAPFPTVVRRGDVVAGRYEIRDRLGRGGMGAVYRAHDVVLGEDIALKLLRPDVGQSAELSWRFRSEIKVARSITHPNVCRIHDYGEAEGRQFISMELVDGVDLRRWMRERGPLPREEAYEIALQLARGLEAVHEMGVVHRDLKPQNAMRDSKGRIRLMDFGIAKRVQSDATTAGTAEGSILGTPEYMSPEQARGQETDFRSDIYSLGILIFELFAGRAPFVGQTPVATLLQHVEAEPPFNEPVATPIPASLRPVLAQALAKDPAQRQQTVTGLLAAVESARQDSIGDAMTHALPTTQGHGAPVDSASTVTRVSTGGQRSTGATRQGWLLAAAALLASVSALVWGIHWLRSTEALPAIAVVPTSTETGSAPRTMSDDEEAIRQVLGVFAWAIRTRDLGAFERLRPSLSPEDRTRLEEAFRAIRSQRVSMTVESVEIRGDTAIATVSRQDLLDGRLTNRVKMTFRLSRAGDSWRIEGMGP